MVNREEMLSIRCQCKLVSVNRSSFYYKPLGETEENLKIMGLMDEHYLNHPTEGVKRMRGLRTGSDYSLANTKFHFSPNMLNHSYD
jgi:putative transposase